MAVKTEKEKQVPVNTYPPMQSMAVTTPNRNHNPKLNSNVML